MAVITSSEIAKIARIGRPAVQKQYIFGSPEHSKKAAKCAGLDFAICKFEIYLTL